ncbi:MAG: RNase adapter RapZ [Bacillota bacterium]|nr:RNase adapter RapZ [Bacillota bacterium]
MSQGIEFVIITGLSGAGKTEAARALEDMGFFCVDNLPPSFIPTFAELCAQSGGKVNRIAMVIDVRGGDFFGALFEALEWLKSRQFRVTILFLEATEEVLIRRFKETRRRHPLEGEGGLLAGIRAERERLEGLRTQATVVLDTSRLNPHQLKEKIYEFLRGKEEGVKGPEVRLISFGYKFGLPLDADLVFDLRFLPNPHYVEELRPKDGREEEVSRYILEAPVTQEFLQALHRFLLFLLPLLAAEGRRSVTIGLGCTGGRHRSVSIVEEVAARLKAEGYPVGVEHRDIAQGKE